MSIDKLKRNIMNDKKLVHNFKSYIGLDENNFQVNRELDKPIEEIKPKLLAGELVIGVAHNVLLYAPVSEKPFGRIGSLFVTNYKLSFITDDPTIGGCRQQSLILGLHDVTLSMIASVFELSGLDEESGGKWRRRPLRPSHPLPKKVQGLQIICKNMRVLSFGFKMSSSGKGRTIAASLLHHAFPKRHFLLFAYEFKEPYYSTVGDVNMFQRYNDWKREMDRTNCQNWRISRANGTAEGFYQGAGESLVVPASVLDYQLSEAAGHFRKGRVPIWVWSTPGGACLVRSGELFNTGNSGNAGTPSHIPESVLLEAIRKTHPAKSPSKLLPLSIPSLRSAFKKLTNLCTPNTMTDFWEQDGQFYSAMENNRWLKYVSECLFVAEQAAAFLSDNITVVLQEGDGMDYCAVVSSLIQLLLDSHSRTIKGFQSLIQKEWIALGHPFSDRLGHVTLDDSDTSEGDREASPVFLLFLDCCWQIQKQFPSSFEFTESYLTTLWDSAHNQLFDTFLFNSPRERELAASKCVTFRSVWDWKEQFIEEDIQYFYNPLYSPPIQHTHPPKSIIPPSAIRLPGLASPQKSAMSEHRWLSPSPNRLLPKTSVPYLDIWQQCYFRWLPLLHLPGSGDIQFLLYHIKITREIKILQEKLATTDINRRSNGTKDEDSNIALDCPSLNTVGAFFPFVGNTTGAGDSHALLTTSLLEPHQQLDSQSILNAPD